MKITLIAICLLVVGACMSWGIYLGLPDWERRAQFGDMFGAVNALFSTFALVGVVAAIFIQKEELTLQRKELEMTRDELQRSASAQEGSALSLSSQLAHQVTASRINGLSALLASVDAEIEEVRSDLRSRGKISSSRGFLSQLFVPEFPIALAQKRKAIRTRIELLLEEIGESPLAHSTENEKTDSEEV